MHIIIAGAGKVGSALAEQLAKENHDVTIIDPNEAVVDRISNSMDVICYVGNGASFPTLKSVGIEYCDVLIAVTHSDELNLMCCLAAHKLGAKHTIARVRNPEYANQLYDLKDDLGLSMSINPERAVAEEISRILRFPAASRVELFARGRVELVSCKLQPSSLLCGLKLKEIPAELGIKVLICIVDRNGQISIPDGNFTLNAGDGLYFTGSPKEIGKAFRKAKMHINPIKSVMIAGGGKVTYYLAQLLSKQNMDIKIIEIDKNRAEFLSQNLENSVILHADASDNDMLSEEGISRTDAFVALTGLDEGNILGALYATQNSVKKVIAKINNENRMEMASKLNIDTVISTKYITTGRILRYVRAVENSNMNDNMQSLYRVLDGKVEVMEFLCGKSIPNLTGIPLSDVALKKNTLIACIVRKDTTIIPSGTDSIQENDSVLVVSAGHKFRNLEDILAEA